MGNNLTEVFVGSDIETQYIASLFDENDIKYIIENTFEQSISAGWASGSPYNGCRIRVDTNDIHKAQIIIKEYYENIGE